VSIEVFNPDTCRWEKKEIPDVSAIISELDSISPSGHTAYDYRNALEEVVNTILMIRIENFKPVRN
tara:strand:+ start:505 stop:702 length:198 start_codon:yes stop_codon:yes gene_type:complete